jgi:CheY-like chemotaxis protein
MGIGSSIAMALATGCGKFLFKRFIANRAKQLDSFQGDSRSGASEGFCESLGGTIGEAVAGGLADAVKDWIKDSSSQRKAVREFEDLGDRVVERLRADLESQHAGVPDDQWERVLTWVNATLAGNITSNFLVQHRVDSAKLFEALLAVPLNVPGPSNEGEKCLFEAALRGVSRRLAAAASRLPKFDEENARATLELLNSLRVDLDQALDDVQFIREQVDKTHGPGAKDEYALDYRQAVARELDRVELFGVDLPDELRRAKLTEAYVTLQLDTTSAATDTGADEDEAARRILVVDDNVDAAQSLAVLLRLEGHNVRVAPDGPTALAAAQAELPEMVVLDLGMPGMDGFEVAQKLQALPGWNDVLLIALTGWAQEEDRRRCQDAGFDGHLPNPMQLEELRQFLAHPKFVGRSQLPS